MPKTPEETLAFILRVLGIVEEYELRDMLFWRTDSKYAPVTFMINCNDIFYWGCADLEPITPENIGILEQSGKDYKEIGKSIDPKSSMYELEIPALFCARVRKMRPQGACYPEDKAYWPLLDACGPKRETGLGNPHEPGVYKTTGGCPHSGG